MIVILLGQLSAQRLRPTGCFCGVGIAKTSFVVYDRQNRLTRLRLYALYYADNGF